MRIVVGAIMLFYWSGVSSEKCFWYTATGRDIKGAKDANEKGLGENEEKPCFPKRDQQLEDSAWINALKSSSLIDDFPEMDPERDFYFYNEEPLDLDRITFLSVAWRRSKVMEDDIEDEEGQSLGSLEFKATEQGDMSGIKGANHKWPLNWMNLLEFPAEKFIREEVCRTSSTVCDWKLLVREVALHFQPEKSQTENGKNLRVKSKAVFLTVSLLYQQTSLFYHAVRCANTEEEHCPQPCSTLWDPCSNLPGTECKVVSALGASIMEDLYDSCLDEETPLLINNIRTHRCECDDQHISIGSLQNSLQHPQKLEKLFWDSDSKQPIQPSRGDKTKTTKKEPDRGLNAQLAEFIRVKMSQGEFCVEPQEVPVMKWKSEL